MKYFLISGALLIGSLCICVLCTAHVREISREMTEHLEEAAEALETDNLSSALEHLTLAGKRWNKAGSCIAAIINGEDFSRTDQSLDMAELYLEREYREEADGELRNLIGLLELICEKERISLKNIL